MLEENDCKLTVVIAFPSTPEGVEKVNKEIEAFAHLEPMKKRDFSKPIYCALGGPPRENAIVKDSKWVHDRKSIVDYNAEDTLLLGNEGTTILEGSQTNFFAVMASGTIVTAGEDVLEGTVRAVVIDACSALSIPLKFEAPKVSQIEDFKEAFLASTSRLILPIDVIGSHKLPAERPITTKISNWVRQHVEERSASLKAIHSIV
jgi:hypothetical protein